jgi:molecular chaperone GrpE (heat shock protein)
MNGSHDVDPNPSTSPATDGEAGCAGAGQEPDAPRGGDVLPTAPPACAVDVLTVVAGLQETVREMRDVLSAAETRLSTLEAAADAAGKQIAFLPPQMRMLAAKIDGVATSVSEPRLRALLLGVLSVYDLVEQARRSVLIDAATEAGALALRHYDVLRTQLRQLMESNGLAEVSSDGRFDPLVHRAIERVPVTDPSQANAVVQVLRPGFRTDQTVLRYAEVSVGCYTPAEGPAEAGGAESGPASSAGSAGGA